MDSVTREEAELIAEKKARDYCDALGERLVSRVIPAAITAAVQAHDHSIRSHGGLQVRLDRAKWIARLLIICLAVMGGAGIERLVGVLG